jgi:hypothetical protein
MPLSCLRDDCHKQAVTHIQESWRFKSMYTLLGKTRPTHHTLSTLSSRMAQDYTYLMWSTYRNPPWDADRFGRISLLPKKGLPTQSTARWPTDPRVRTQFLSRASQWSSRRKPSSYRWPTTMLTGAINTNMRSVHSILPHGGQLIGT